MFASISSNNRTFFIHPDVSMLMRVCCLPLLRRWICISEDGGRKIRGQTPHPADRTL